MKFRSGGKRFLSWTTALAALSLLPGLDAPASAQQLDSTLGVSKQGNAESAKSQRRVDTVSDQTEELLRKYRTELAQIESLRVYNRQLEKLLAAQEAEMSSITEQIEGITMVGREISPLMLRMVESLENFVDLDVPFLPNEREHRLAGLNEMLGRSDVSDSEKFRRILEAFQIENEYGRTIEAYQGELDLGGEKRIVDFLRMGRVALLYRTQDGQRVGTWDKDAKQFVELDSSYLTPVREGLRIARKQKAPDLIAMPISAPEAAQ